MRWYRVRARDKLAFREDLQADPTLTDLQKRMISIISQHWDNTSMLAECSLSFIAAGAGTTKKMVNRYASSLSASGRVSIKRAPTYTTSTMWTVNWWFRGGAWVRLNNNGKPILDGRKESPNTAEGESPNGSSPPEVGVPQLGDQFPSKEGDIGAPNGSGPLTGPHGRHKEKKPNPHRTEPGFSKWKIVHAEFSDDDAETFVAHLRSGKNRKFVLRCHIDSDEYGNIDDALGIDGDAEVVIGNMVQMSTNRSGAKVFMRSGPLPWVQATVLSGETNEDGSGKACVTFGDNEKDGFLPLKQEEVLRLMDATDGQPAGAQVRYRLMPDDMLQFEPMDPTEYEEAA